MGRPQNFVSFSLWMRSCLMYLVVGGSAIGGMTLSSCTRIAGAGFGPGFDGDLLRSAVEVAGRLVPLLPFATIHWQLDDGSDRAMKRLVLVQQRLDPVLAGGNLAQALEGITRSSSRR